MDNELLKKVNDTLKANGMRELSMDEMDKVNGGYFVPNTDEEKKQLIDYAYALTDSFGFDIALDMFMKTTGYETYRDGVSGGTDRDKMGVVLNGYMTMLDAGGGYH